MNPSEPTFTRADGRSPVDQRDFSVRFGTLARADGSARVSMGPNALVASFSGPIEVRIRDERLDRATLEISHRPLDGMAGIPSKTLSTTLLTSLSPLLQLHSHPRSLLLLTLQSLSAPPLPTLPTTLSSSSSSSQQPPPTPILPPLPLSTKALALTAASLAAMDASSVGMLGLGIGACVCVVSEEGGAGGWVVDPDWEEERTARARFGVGWGFGAGLGVKSSGDGGEGGRKGEEVVWFEAEGEFQEEEIAKALELSLVAARQTLALVRSKVEIAFLESATAAAASSSVVLEGEGERGEAMEI